jgi:hypothetical protein
LKLRSLRIAVLSVLTLAAIGCVLAAALVWRLSQGPVSISFMRPSIVKGINSQLGSLRADLGDAILEVDPETNIPSVRILNVALKDEQGNVLASAPKAAVSLDLAAVMRGEIVARTLDLIGPRVVARRNLDGRFELGFDNAIAATQADVSQTELNVDLEAPTAEDEASGKTDLGGASETEDTTAKVQMGRRLIELFAERSDSNQLSSLETVRISQAHVTVFDEANDAKWISPKSDLAFRKMPYGFILAAKTQIATGGEPWALEFTASYRRVEKSFTINAAIANLIPADLSDEIFALSDFAKVTVPLSGQVQIDVSEEGRVTKAGGQFIASAGKVSFPDYFVRTFVVDEGTLDVVYDADREALNIVKSSLLIGGSQVALRGELKPVRDETGKTRSIAIRLDADNAKIDTQGTVKDAVLIEKISFQGNASMDERVLQIDGIRLQSGASRFEVAGQLQGGQESMGFTLNGSMSKVSAALLKVIWPPIIAAKSRDWVSENIKAGTIDEGTFALKFAPDELVRSLREKRMSQSAVSAEFSMSGVESTYFKSLPQLEAGVGRARLLGDRFELDLTKGYATLQSGEVVKLSKGSFIATEMMSGRANGAFDFDLNGSIGALLETGNHPDIKRGVAVEKLPEILGQAQVALRLNMPLIKAPPPSEVKLTTAIKLANVSAKDVVPGVSLADGDFAVDLAQSGVSVTGPANLNGYPAKISWVRPRGEEPVIKFSTTFDDKTRERLGLKFAEYVQGPINVDVQIVGAGNNQRIEVDADLSAVSMKLAAMGWSRAKTKGTRASFSVINGAKGRKIDNLTVRGAGLELNGDIELTSSNTLKVLKLSNISLDGESRFAARIEPQGKITDIVVSGKTFDATPYIKNLVSPSKSSSEEAASSTIPSGSFRINARFERVYAYRGEVVKDVIAELSTRGKLISSASINGAFLNGQPIAIRLDQADGARELRVNSQDGGGTLRAANFYSKIAGGDLEFYALMLNKPGSPIKNGQLNISNFAVRDEAALAELDSRGRPKKSGPRKGGVTFKRLTMPFVSDGQYIRLGDTMLRGPEIGATAEGIIRKSDGAIDITGTYIPAYGLNAALGKVPLLGDILTGGNREGFIGLTYAMSGTIKKPKFQINPLSAVAPGIFRKLFEFQPGRRPRVDPEAAAAEPVPEAPPATRGLY